MKHDDPVVDQLAEVTRCGNGSASLLCMNHGAAAWRRCVRYRGHDGDHVMGITEMEQEILDGKREGGYPFKNKVKLTWQKYLADSWFMR